MITETTVKSLLGSANIPNISGIIVKQGKIFLTLEIDQKDLENSSQIEQKILKALESIADKKNIKFIFTSHNSNAQGKKKHHIDGVKKLILVASGKGGVGKSTMAVALSKQYQAAGYRVGLVDADIYGPSIPTMFGVSQKPEIIGQKFIPLEAGGIKLISVGFLVDFDTPIAWRGPMASKILYQMLSTTLWGELDYLIVDMPPGTGDVHLSILENYHIDGVVIVTTSQDISMVDVDRAIGLYRKFDVPILSIIENMSDLFPGNAGEILARKYSVEKLQRITFDRGIAEGKLPRDL